ncbi:hypothetical protein [Gemmatimonas sp.]|jgi:hypothetical protein|uniref:hypothetical protein n=1 Tax=Gemmatimonas sp. TaxID=1962908 RepID=UPI0022CA4C83|nr:hypothetical protein [Gemmatimonas sp.]MCZ8206022.1 hypothetical protein [Gemmatimonas sp.]
MADRKSFLLRVDRELLDAVQRWANDDLRSLNGQVEFLLRRALREAGRAPKGRSSADVAPAPDPSDITEPDAS